MAGTEPASASPPLIWSTIHIDSRSGASLVGVSCASSTLCVATDDRSDVLSSTDPTGGASAWRLAPNLPTPFFGVSCPTSSLCVAGTESSIHATTDPTGEASAWPVQAVYVFPPELCTPGSEFAPCFGPLASVSCASPSLCVASLDSEDDFNELVTSTDPLGGESAWHPVEAPQIHGSRNKLPPPNLGEPVLGVSCVSAALCVAVDAAGNVLTSTDPGSSESTWTIAPIDTAPIWDVSCPSLTLCVAVDGEGQALTSTNPTGGSAAWKKTPIDGTNLLRSVSCASATLCVAVDAVGNALNTTDPTGGTNAWSIALADTGHALNDISCVAAAFCVAVDNAGNATLARLPSQEGEGPPEEKRGGEQPPGGGQSGGGGQNGGKGTPGTPPPPILGSFVVVRARGVGNGRIELTLQVPGAGAIKALATTAAGTAAGGKPQLHRKIRYPAITLTTSGPGAVKAVLKPTRRILEALRHMGTLHLRVSVTFNPSASTPITRLTPVTVHAQRSVPRKDERPRRPRVSEPEGLAGGAA